VEFHRYYADSDWVYLLFTWEDAKLNVRRQWSFVEVQKVLKQLAEGLRYLHSKDLVHRDIKPDNILLTSEDLSIATVKLADFGLSKVLQPNAIRDTPLIGTPHYSAPEILNRDRHYGCKVDVWSYGVVAYELLTGTKPFPAKERIEELIKMQNEGVPRGTRFPEGYEDICQDFVDFCLVKNPQERPCMEDVLRHPFFDFTPHLWSAVHIVKEADGLLDKIQRMQFYLARAGMDDAYQQFKTDAKVLAINLRNACLQVRGELDEGNQDLEQVTAVLERINMFES
jgi:serine/threonine protein kinase